MTRPMEVFAESMLDHSADSHLASMADIFAGLLAADSVDAQKGDRDAGEGESKFYQLITLIAVEDDQPEETLGLVAGLVDWWSRTMPITATVRFSSRASAVLITAQRVIKNTSIVGIVAIEDEGTAGEREPNGGPQA